MSTEDRQKCLSFSVLHKKRSPTKNGPNVDSTQSDNTITPHVMS